MALHPARNASVSFSIGLTVIAVLTNLINKPLIVGRLPEPSAAVWSLLWT
jgi:hypothetical protein